MDPDDLVAQVLGVREEVSLLAVAVLVDGLITNDKFCFIRHQRLSLTWPRYPASSLDKRLERATSTPAYPPHEATRHGGKHDTPVARLQVDSTAPGRQPTPGSSLPEHPALDFGERTNFRSEFRSERKR